MSDSPPTFSARAALADEQSRLVAALITGADPPEAFDAGRVRLAARTLVAKRRRAVEQTWPVLASALDESWRAAFDDYASGNPVPAGGGPFDDGLALARHLRRENALPLVALPPLLIAEARGGFPPLRVGLTSRPRRLVIALRVGRWARAVTVPLP